VTAWVGAQPISTSSSWHPDRDDLDDAAQRASARLAREVNITIRSLTWWRESTDGFHTEITTRPLIRVLPQQPDGEITPSGRVTR
jgi:hypothetical protein